MDNIANIRQKIEISNKINLKRVENIDIENCVVYEASPIELVDYRRFDIVAKYIYGWFESNGINSNWGKRLYDEHMWVFNNYDEDDDSGKKGIRSFIRAYDATLKSIKTNGFNSSLTLIPVGRSNVPLDGAHRVAASLVYNQSVKVVKVSEQDVNYNYEFFRNKGLRTKWSDAIAFEYCSLKNSKIKIFFVNGNVDIPLKSILEKHSTIFYLKEIYLTREGFSNLIIQLSISDKECIDILNKLADISDHIQLSCVVLEEIFSGAFSLLKYDLNQFLNGNNQLYYLSQSNIDIKRLAQILFNDNSIHFLNNTRKKELSQFSREIREYKNELNDDFENQGRHYCIVAQGVLAAYGLKEVSLLEFIHSGVKYKSSSLLCVNDRLLESNVIIDDIIYNPENHFYFEGVKFASPKAVKKINSSEKEFRRSKDYKLINDLIKPINIEDVVYAVKKRLKICKLVLIHIKLKTMKMIKKLKMG